MSDTTLSQWVGIRKGVSQKATSETTVLHRESQKTAPYSGFSKNYRPKDTEGEQYPPETKKVTQVGPQILERLAETETDWWDVVATCDQGNTVAKANVEVDGRVLVQDASVPFLLFLEKRINDIRTFLEKMPTLDENEDWIKDPNSDLFKTEKQSNHKTKKVQRAIVLYDATEHHPAQTQMITEDVVIGWWDQVKMSGALPEPRKRELLKRTEKVLRAVKFAMAQANGTQVEKAQVGATVFGYLFE